MVLISDFSIRKNYQRLASHRLLKTTKLQAFSVETAGMLGLDSELKIYFSGLGKVKFEFSSICNQHFTNIVLQTDFNFYIVFFLCSVTLKEDEKSTIGFLIKTQKNGRIHND